MGAVWGDYDNDGFEDLLLYRWGRPELFHNDGGRRFTRVTEPAGLPAWANINTAVWLDYDRDGRLDLFIGGYYAEDVEPLEARRHADHAGELRVREQRRPQVSVPQPRRRALRGGQRAASASRSRRWALAAVAADLRGTGYPDLFIANDYGVSELFVNEGGRFREVGRETGVGYAPKSGMNASVGDVLNQGRFAIYVSNISEEGILHPGQQPVGADGRRRERCRTYENLARSMGVDLGGWSFGAQFGDLNNDGFLDLYLVNGYVSARATESYWYDYSKVAGGHEVVISDAKNWPAMGDAQPRRATSRRGSGSTTAPGRFIDVAQMVGVTDRYDGRSVALADFGEPRRARRGRRQPARTAAALPQRGRARARLDRLRARGRLPAGHARGQRAPTAARSARRSRCSGTASSRCRKSPAARASARRTSAACTSGSAPRAAVDKAVVRWPRARCRSSPHPPINQVHKLKEPA